MLRRKRSSLCAILLAALVTIAGTRTAETQTKPATDRWHVTFAPYVMGASLDGTVVIKGQEAEVDVSASKIFDHLDFGFMAMLAARKGDWGVTGDVIHVALGIDNDMPPGTFDPTLDITTVQGLRRLNDHADVTFGARWTHLKGELSLDAPISVDVERTRDWVDPIVGVALRTSGTHRWHAMLLADVGGTGSGDFTWQVFPSVGIKINEKASFEFGWRFLETDYETGDGSDRFKYDMLYEGPAAGVAINF